MRPETYSSLKAVHGAWRVAMGYMHRRPIDVVRQSCPRCGRELDFEGEWDEGRVVCRACRKRVKVPGYVVAELERRYWAGKRLSGFTDVGTSRRTERGLVGRIMLWSALFVLFLLVLMMAAVGNNVR